jgi:hypothetical protein
VSHSVAYTRSRAFSRIAPFSPEISRTPGMSPRLAWSANIAGTS